jgi:MFS family permease
LSETPSRDTHIRAWFVAVYAFAYASLWLALLTPATVTLALRVRQLAPADATRSVSLVLFAGAVVALVSNPIFGMLSDRTRSRLGRRRPYLLAGALAGLAALWIIGLAPGIGMVLFGWCLAQLAYNAVLAALVAVVADEIPTSRRGTVVGVLGICMPVGQISGTFLVQHLAFDLLLALLVPGVIGLVGVWPLAFALPRSRPATASRIDVATAPSVPAHRATWRLISGLARHRDFSWAWSSRAFFVVGSVSLQAYQPFLLLDVLGFDATAVPGLIFRSTLVQAAMMVLWSLLAGRLSDRWRRRKPIAMVGSVLQGVGLWLVAMADSYTMLLCGVAVAGIGHGTYEGVNLALVTEVLPDRDQHAAKGLGLLNVANALPQVIAPLVAPLILASSHGNYRLLFLVAGTVPVLGAALLLPLRGAR